MRKHARLLFIGNSFTARNDLPGMLARLADASGRRVEHELVQAGGASLKRHWNAGEAHAAIARGGWTHVVLQEQSTLPLKDRERFHENVRRFAPAVRAAGAELTLYATWAREAAPEAAHAQLADAYDAIARELKATLVPVGMAWRRAKVAGLALYDRDGSHPSPLGTYLAACVFHVALLGPLPKPLGEVEPLAAARAHRIATAVLR